MKKEDKTMKQQYKDGYLNGWTDACQEIDKRNKMNKKPKAENKDIDPNGDRWVKINIPTLKKYGVKPFSIMKRKMRKNNEVWNNISFYDAQKEAEKLGYRLPDIREMLAILEYYKQKNKNVSENDKEFLGIEELSYEEDVHYEWIEGAGCAFLRGGYWSLGARAGAFALTLGAAPGNTSYAIGFRCAR